MPGKKLVWALFLLVLIGMTACFSHPSSPEEAIAELKQAMAERPSASTAGKMLDLAIDSEDKGLVLSVLQDILPWTQVQGVAEVFIRGSKYFIAREALGETVFWLEEEVLKLDPLADLNEALASSYNKSGAREAEIHGDRLFARWELDDKARERFLTIFKAKKVWTAPLPLNGGESQVVPDFPERLANRQEYSSIVPYVELWEACWKQDLDVDKLAILDSLDADDDPLGLYWPLRATFLVQGLDTGWDNPLGLDVAIRIHEVIGNLDREKQEEVLNILYDKRDSSSALHSKVILDILAQEDFGWHWGERIPGMILTLIPGVDLDVSLVYLEQPELDILQEYEDLFEGLHEIYHIFGGFQVLKEVSVPESMLELKQSFHFDTFLGMSISPIAPAALIDGEDGQLLLDFSTGKLTEYPGCWGSWSPRGDEFALFKAGDPESEIIICSAQGTELERHLIPAAIQGKQGAEVVFIPRVTWNSPTELGISRRLLRGVMYGIMPSPYNYSFDLGTKVLTETKWRSTVSHVFGTDLYYINKFLYDMEEMDEPEEEEMLIDQAGNSIGEVLPVEYQDGVNRVVLPNNAQLVVEDYTMFFKDSEGNKTKVLNQWEAFTINWAVMHEDKVFAEVYLSIPRTKGCGFQTQIVLDPASSVVSILRNNQSWYEDTATTCSSQTNTEIPALFFADSWFFNFTSSTITVDEIPLPAAVTNLFRVFKYGDSYILVVGDGSEYGSVEGKAVILVFE